MAGEVLSCWEEGKRRGGSGREYTIAIGERERERILNNKGFSWKRRKEGKEVKKGRKEGREGRKVNKKEGREGKKEGKEGRKEAKEAKEGAR